MVRKTNYKRFYLGDNYPGIYFTKREAQCMQYFIAGFTNIKTAAVLNLSERTVEFYLKNMKRKLICRTKHQLIEKVFTSGFALKSNNQDQEI